jgi:Icc-related predicted phosphoesterase
MIKKHWDLIPKKTEVLITHGPPHNILDRVFDGKLVGCEELLIKVQEIKPRLHIFGHIHEARGVKEIAETTYVNASSLDVAYKQVFMPFVF